MKSSKKNFFKYPEEEKQDSRPSQSKVCRYLYLDPLTQNVQKREMDGGKGEFFFLNERRKKKKNLQIPKNNLVKLCLKGKSNDRSVV